MDEAKKKLRERANALATIVDGKPLADLSVEEQARLGYERNPVNANEVRPIASANAQAPIVRFDNGKPVISEAALADLQQDFPLSVKEIRASGVQTFGAKADGANQSGGVADKVPMSQENSADGYAPQPMGPTATEADTTGGTTADSGGNGAAPDFPAVAKKVNDGIARRTKERAGGTLKEEPGDLHPAWSLTTRSRLTEQVYAKLEGEHAKLDAERAKSNRAELFEDVADIWQHALPRVKRLIESETMKYDGSSNESFRTTVSKKILNKYRKDRTFLNGFKWKEYGESHLGPVPLVRGVPIVGPHTHHRVKQKGFASEHPFVRESQHILWEAGIDPLFGLESLGFAPMNAKGQHTIAESKETIEKLRYLKESGADYAKYVKLLHKIGRTAARR